MESYRFGRNNDYYDVNLKKDRHKVLEENHDFKSYEGFLQDQKLLDNIFKT